MSHEPRSGDAGEWVCMLDRYAAVWSQAQAAPLPPRTGLVTTRLRSPYTLSTRAVVGQNLLCRVQLAGNAAASRVYGLSHASLSTMAAGCGAFVNMLLSAGSCGADERPEQQ